MRLILLVILLTAVGCGPEVEAPPDYHSFGWENRRHAKESLDDYRHILLVRIDDDVMESGGPHKYSMYRGNATVVRVYKGGWRVGEKIAFSEGYDYEAAGGTNAGVGRFNIVFANKHRMSSISLDTGERRSYDAELEKCIVAVCRDAGR